MLLRKTPVYYFQLSRHIIILLCEHIHTQGTENFAEENISIITQAARNSAEENISIILPIKQRYIYIIQINTYTQTNKLT